MNTFSLFSHLPVVPVCLIFSMNQMLAALNSSSPVSTELRPSLGELSLREQLLFLRLLIAGS